MNRAQRRQQEKNRTKEVTKKKSKLQEFSNVPTLIICQSIQMLINELERRGFNLYDFDNKKKMLRQIQIIQDKGYFLAEEDKTSEK